MSAKNTPPHICPQSPYDYHHRQTPLISPAATLSPLDAYALPYTGEQTAKCGQRHACKYKDCGKSFTTSAHLSRHVKLHTGQRPHKCPLPGCKKEFARRDNMLVHCRTHAKKIGTVSAVCEKQKQPLQNPPPLLEPQQQPPDFKLSNLVYSKPGLIYPRPNLLYANKHNTPPPPVYASSQPPPQEPLIYNPQSPLYPCTMQPSSQPYAHHVNGFFRQRSYSETPPPPIIPSNLNMRYSRLKEDFLYYRLLYHANNSSAAGGSNSSVNANNHPSRKLSEPAPLSLYKIFYNKSSQTPSPSQPSEQIVSSSPLPQQ